MNIIGTKFEHTNKKSNKTNCLLCQRQLFSQANILDLFSFFFRVGQL